MQDEKNCTYYTFAKDEPISRSNILEFIGDIVGIFEDYLDANRIWIFNPERDKEIDALISKDGSITPEHALQSLGYARIYGDDYDAFENELEWLFYQTEEENEDLSGYALRLSPEELSKITNSVFDVFTSLLERNPAPKVSENRAARLKDEIKQTFAAWKFVR